MRNRVRLSTAFLRDRARETGLFLVNENGNTYPARDWSFRASAHFYEAVFPPDTPIPNILKGGAPEDVALAYVQNSDAEVLINSLITFTLWSDHLPGDFNPLKNGPHIQLLHDTAQDGAQQVEMIAQALRQNPPLRDQMLRTTFEAHWVEQETFNQLDPVLSRGARHASLWSTRMIRPEPESFRCNRFWLRI